MVRLAPGQGKAKEQTELSTRSMLGLREKIHTLPPEGNSAMALHIDTREEPHCSRRGSIKPSTVSEPHTKSPEAAPLEGRDLAS